MPEKFSAMRNNEAVSNETAYSLGENKDSPSLERLNYRAKQRENQRKSREKTDERDHEKADVDLDNEISSLEISSKNDLNDFLEKNYPNNTNVREIAISYFETQSKLGLTISEQKLDAQILQKIDNIAEISNEDRIKDYKSELTEQGKSQTEILSLLISKFENNEAVSKWVENWRNFQKLHQFAETKPPAERKAIQNIISKADFSSEDSFSTSLQEIGQSKDLSDETKSEISREFGGAHIDSVDGMDYQLQQVKTHNKEIEKAIDKKNEETESLDSEIQNIEAEIDELSLNDPKRLELENKLEQSKKSLNEVEVEISRLEKGKIQDVSFQLREGFNSVLNPDGSRSVKIMDSDFTIKLTNNFLPFRTTASLNSINLAFSYNALKQNNIADFIFRPNLVDGSVPSRSQRKTSELILSNLGYDTTRILNKEDIKQLNKDLSSLNSQVGKTGEESLIELGIFDTNSRSLNTGRLKEVLTTIRENRGLVEKVFMSGLKNNFN